MKLTVAVGKVIVLAGWIWGIVSFIAPSSVPAPDVGRMFVLGLLAVHIGEAWAFSKGLVAEKGGTVADHAWRLVVFGYLHVLTVRYG